MLEVRLLSWNIQTFTQRKYVHQDTGQINANAGAVTYTLARLVQESSANMLSILELAPTSADSILQGIIDQLRMLDLGDWRYMKVISHRRESYGLLFQMGQGFEPVLREGPPPDNLMPEEVFGICGETNLDAMGQPLNFQEPSGPANGREPAYFFFQASSPLDVNPFYFSVIAYHAMFARTKQNNAQGITNVAYIYPVKKGGLSDESPKIQRSLVSGDFNYDLLQDSSPYAHASQNVQNLAVYPSQGAAAKSTVARDPMASGTPLIDYRRSAYDNIMSNGKVIGEHNGVVDMMDLLKNLLSDCAFVFNRQAKASLATIQNIPPERDEDAWRLFRKGISDHLPVFAVYKLD